MRREAGFTLLEVTVALVVFGLLLVGLGQGVSFGLQAFGRQTRSVAAASELDAVDRALRTIVARLDPASEVKGAAHAMAFTSRLPDTAALATHEADMLLTVDAEHRLVLRWTPHLHAQRLAPAPRPDDAELLRGVDRLDLAYWPADGNGWRDAWSSRGPPAMVRLRVIFPPGDPRHWADIVASPARTAPDP